MLTTDSFIICYIFKREKITKAKNRFEPKLNQKVRDLKNPRNDVGCFRAKKKKKKSLLQSSTRYWTDFPELLARFADFCSSIPHRAFSFTNASLFESPLTLSLTFSTRESVLRPNAFSTSSLSSWISEIVNDCCGGNCGSLKSLRLTVFKHYSGSSRSL